MKLRLLLAALVSSVALLSCGGGVEQVKVVEVKGIRIEMVGVKGGTFMMGATSEQGSDAENNEYPVHKVKLDDYYIGKYEVTQELWEAVMGNNPSEFKGRCNPVDNVSWNDCQEFIAGLNRMTGLKFSLPTEAQWEYAARGGNKSQGYKYSGSNNLNEVAWYSGYDDFDEWLANLEDVFDNDTTHQVGQKQPNELGIYDMSGNVWEWCQDWYSDKIYTTEAVENPQGPSVGNLRVLRGGSWRYYTGLCRVSIRGNLDPDFGSGDFGLRLVLLP